MIYKTDDNAHNDLKYIYIISIFLTYLIKV